MLLLRSSGYLTEGAFNGCPVQDSVGKRPMMVEAGLLFRAKAASFPDSSEYVQWDNNPQGLEPWSQAPCRTVFAPWSKALGPARWLHFDAAVPCCFSSSRLQGHVLHADSPSWHGPGRRSDHRDDESRNHVCGLHCTDNRRTLRYRRRRVGGVLTGCSLPCD
jgi:hypothetical protein